MAREAVYGIVFSKDRKKILLVKRRDLPVWVLPGGGLDAGESPEQGALRETEEETGLEVSLKRAVAVYLPVNRLTQKTFFFELEQVGGHPKPSAEAQEVAFFALDQLPKRLAPPFAHWIRDACLESQEIIIKKTEGVTYTLLLKLIVLHPILVLRYFLTKLGIRFNAGD